MWSTRAGFILTLLVAAPVATHAQPMDPHGDPSLCDIHKPNEGCSQAQRQFIANWVDKPAAEMQKQLDTLKGVMVNQGASMEAHTRLWTNQRIGILEQAIAGHAAHPDYSLCNMYEPEKSCSKAQRQFIANWVDKTAEEMQKEADQLQGTIDSQGESMKPAALTWAQQRIVVLKQGVERHEKHQDYSLCNIYEADKGCSQAQRQYISNWVDKAAEDMQKEIDQLQATVEKEGASMKPHKLTWAEHRIGILKQLAKRSEL